ncbi:hypothetical protein FH972_023792 [Carpinus fangiana]|uniref:Uncharacterized protein n=1 Tax=Carpinus fangiana TaxID=176857 RepID=A0A5N6KWP7_9ROSI|nr:hypothetical protein FH972_023792 [Carpinus fangiana]
MFSRRILTIIAFLTISVILILSFRSNPIPQKSWQELSEGLSQRIGLGDWARKYNGGNETATQLMHMKPNFHPGTTQPPGYNYTKLLITARTKGEDVAWMEEHIPDIQKAIYVADDPEAPLHPPQNKGHEVMIYLSYIIDNYDALPDVMIFMHAHRYAWHNADLFGSDAGRMIKQLSAERVTREGYVNMRCHWYPGCPDWMHPGETQYDGQKSEEILIAHAWAELFPLDPVPDVLAQPCCAQFAVSRDRVRTIPLEKFLFYRDWLLHTPLQDFVSGRVWEYMWQFVFTGESFWCPAEDVCYCDGFGVCFEEGIDGYHRWFELRGKRNDVNDKLLDWEAKRDAIARAIQDGRVDEAKEMEEPEKGLDQKFRLEMAELTVQMEELVEKGIERGKNPRVRAEVAGRPFSEGDGF